EAAAGSSQAFRLRRHAHHGRLLAIERLGLTRLCEHDEQHGEQQACPCLHPGHARPHSKATIGNAIASAPAATCSLGEPGAQPTDYCYGGGNSAGAALAAYSDEPVRRPIPDPGSETLPHSSRSRRIVCVFSGVSRSIETMKTLPCNDILSGRAPSDTPVTLRGWVRTRRDSKAGISFIHVSDGSCFHPVQVVAPNTLPNYASEVLHLTAGCAVEATGMIVPSPAKGQPFEMQANAIKVIGWVEDPDSYPIQPKPHSLEFLREVAHLRPRTNVIGAVTRVRHTVAQAIHRFFDERGFFWVNTPIITASDAEGAGELFRVSTLDMMNLPRAPDGKIDYSQDFFGREAFLTVSGQLNVETYCMALSKVYTFGPTFR